MIRIGTRGSKLALWQADHVAGILKLAGIASEIKVIETKGDKMLNASFAEIGTKGVFTEEIEDQLRKGNIDIAVHSAKDLQSVIPEGLEIVAFGKREKANDVVVSFHKDFSIYTPGKKLVGTSSTRRRAILAHYYPNVEVADARGNLQTRFKKLENDQFEAMVLAYAGVHRLGLDEYIVQELPLQIFTPPVAQGAIAVEASVNLDPEKKGAINTLVNDMETATCLRAERAFLKKLEGGCSIPAFGIAECTENGITMNGGVISLNGEKMVRKSVTSTDQPESVGIQLADEVLGDGGAEILDEIKNGSVTDKG